METKLDNENEEGVLCVEEDGDASISRVHLNLWNICLSVQRKFGAEVIFTYSSVSYPAQMDPYICFYVPRDHAQVAEIEAELREALEPVRQHLDEFSHESGGWRPTVNAWIYRYSGIAGAVAFDDASRRAMQEGFEQRQLDPQHLITLAGAEGRKAARSALRRH
jgi:hypothetical protein